MNLANGPTNVKCPFWLTWKKIPWCNHIIKYHKRHLITSNTAFVKELYYTLCGQLSLASPRTTGLKSKLTETRHQTHNFVKHRMLGAACSWGKSHMEALGHLQCICTLTAFDTNELAWLLHNFKSIRCVYGAPPPPPYSAPSVASFYSFWVFLAFRFLCHFSAISQHRHSIWSYVLTTDDKFDCRCKFQKNVSVYVIYECLIFWKMTCTYINLIICPSKIDKRLLEGDFRRTSIVCIIIHTSKHWVEKP